MKSMSHIEAKRIIREKGYSVRRGAVAMGYSYVHLAFMLTARRPVSRLAAKLIAALPPSPVAYQEKGFAAKTLSSSQRKKH